MDGGWQVRCSWGLLRQRRGAGARHPIANPIRPALHPVLDDDLEYVATEEGSVVPMLEQVHRKGS